MVWNLPTIPVLDINFIIMNNKEEKLKKILFDIIDRLSKDADVYHYNESLWLIHTEDRKWIVEYTELKTLWFNYNFFRSAFKFVSLDVDSNRHYVTEWFETRFLKPKVEDNIQNEVKDTENGLFVYDGIVEETIQNGVKRTRLTKLDLKATVEGTIQNGVKYTSSGSGKPYWMVEDTIQNGVKRTRYVVQELPSLVEDTIQNGVKSTRTKPNPLLKKVEDTIQNGVKHTKTSPLLRLTRVEDTIQNGHKFDIKKECNEQ